MSYPICSVVAVFNMLIRILNTLRSRIWDMTLFLFFCVLAPHGMNEIVFGEMKGERSEGRLSENFSESMRMMARIQEIREALPGIDCGACGSPTCRAFAEDIVRGNVADITQCKVLDRS